MKTLKKLICALTILATLSLSACSAYSSSWKIVRKTSEAGDFLQYYSILNLEGTQKISSVWVNVSGLKEENAVIKLNFGHEAKSVDYKLQTITIDKNVLKKSKGWVRLYGGDAISYAYLKITTDNTMDIGELIVVGENGNVLGADISYSGYKAPNGSSKKEFTKTELEVEGEKNSALCLVDEQDSFDLEEVTALFENAQQEQAE